MPKGILVAIYIAERAGAPMQEVQELEAVAGQGLRGDRYASAQGSFNKNTLGKRQVTLMNTQFFVGSGFTFADSRRNLFTSGVELMWLIGREFRIGTARFKGIKYCDPCDRPTALASKEKSFRESFSDRGGLIAEILESGIIKQGDEIVTPPKGY